MTARHAPLDGVRVVALEQAVAGPLCSRHLLDLGASVVKVERVDGGDLARGYDDMVGGFASHFVWLNRGKRSLALDVKSTRGRELLLELLEDADVLLSNLGPGAIDRLAPPETLAQGNPGLISCVITGYGPDGPYQSRKAYDAIVQGEAGVTRSTGTPGEWAKPGVSLADLACGTYAVAAITAALFERERTGVGRTIHLSMFDVVCEWMMPLLLAERHGPGAPTPAGLRHASIVPYGPFASADGVLLNIAVQNDGQWQRLASHVLQDPELAQDTTLDANAGRLAQRDRVEDRVQAVFGALTAETLEDRLTAADVPWGRLNDPADVVSHPDLTARRRWQPCELPDGTTADVLAHPFLTDLPDEPPLRVPVLGEHSLEVVAQLGHGDETSALVADRVIAVSDLRPDAEAPHRPHPAPN